MLVFDMILVAIGSNLPHPVHGAPIKVCEAAVKAISISECRILSVSQWFSSAPVPVSDQPDFVNGVVSVETTFPQPAFWENCMESRRILAASGACPMRHAPSISI